MKLIDLARPLENTPFADPPALEPKIEYFDHGRTAEQMLAFFPGVTRDALPGGEGWAVEVAHVSTHNGTHVDAPYHYHSTMDGGARAIAIDEVPLEWFMGPGAKLDFREKADGHVVSAAEIEAELARIGHELQPGDIVLVNTAAAAAWGTKDYVPSGCGMGREATLYSDGARRSPMRHGRLELGCALRAYGEARGRDGGCVPDLGGASRRHGEGLLSDREARQSGAPAADRLRGDLLSGEDQRRQRRLGAGPWR